MGYDPNNPYPVPLALRPAGEGLIAGIREWANNPLAFAWGTPTASPEPPKKADKKGTYTTPNSIEAQRKMAERFPRSSVSEAAALSGSKGLRAAGAATDFGTAFMPYWMAKQASDKEAANEAMRQEAVKQAMAAGTPEAMTAALSAYPGYGDLVVQQRMKEVDPTTGLNQRLLKAQVEQAERKDVVQQYMQDLLKGEAGAPGPAPQVQAPADAGPAIMGPAMAAEGATPASPPPQAAEPPPAAAPAAGAPNPSQMPFHMLFKQQPREEQLAYLAAFNKGDVKTMYDIGQSWRNPKSADFGSFKDKVNYEQELRKEFTSQPTVKEYATVRDAYGKVQGAAVDKSPAGDISMIFAYMKMLDPQSTVREGEFATAQNATGVPGQIQNIYNRVLSGTRLNDDQRLDFQNQAKKVYGVHDRQYNALRGQYAKLAKRAGVDPDTITLDFAKIDDAQAAETKKSAPTPGGSPYTHMRRNPQTGEKVGFNPQTGQWEKIKDEPVAVAPPVGPGPSLGEMAVP